MNEGPEVHGVGYLLGLTGWGKLLLRKTKRGVVAHLRGVARRSREPLQEVEETVVGRALPCVCHHGHFKPQDFCAKGQSQSMSVIGIFHQLTEVGFNTERGA